MSRLDPFFELNWPSRNGLTTILGKPETSSVKSKSIDVITNRLEMFQARMFAFLTQNAPVIYFLTFIAICAYGFELFNFNLTIDEEIHAKSIEPVLGWITQGRWGMYVLNKFLLPYTVI